MARWMYGRGVGVWRWDENRGHMQVAKDRWADHHWNEPHEGSKFSIIIYKGNGQMKKTDLVNKLKKQATANNIDGWNGIVLWQM